jgi:hypothetical protein
MVYDPRDRQVSWADCGLGGALWAFALALLVLFGDRLPDQQALAAVHAGHAHMVPIPYRVAATMIRARCWTRSLTPSHTEGGFSPCALQSRHSAYGQLRQLRSRRLAATSVPCGAPQASMNPQPRRAYFSAEPEVRHASERALRACPS